MGTQSIVYGRITFKDNLAKAHEFIKSLGDGETFPFMRTEMFNIGQPKDHFIMRNLF